MNLATDLARYGTAAEWRGVYYRGEKIGFSVSQTTATRDGFEVREDARLADVALRRDDAGRRHDGRARRRRFQPARLRVLARSRAPARCRSTALSRASTSASRSRRRAARKPRSAISTTAPALSLNLPRRMAAAGFRPGTEQRFLVFDPATLRNEPVTVSVGKREIVQLTSALPVRVGSRQVYRPTQTSIPAFKLDMTFAGLHTSSWVTDTGEVVKEESPLGFSSVRESPEDARRLSGRGMVGAALIENAAIVPQVDDEEARRRSRATCAACKSRSTGSPSTPATCTTPASRWKGTSSRSRDPRSLTAGRAPGGSGRTTCSQSRCIESDDPAIRAEAESAVAGVTGARARAEKLTRARQRDARQEADRRPAVGARSAAHEGRRLQRAHRALRRDGAIARAAGAHRRRPRLYARRVLLSRLARGLHRRGRRPRALAAGRSDVQPVSRRRDARAAAARRARQTGRDPPAHRQGEDGHPRSRPRAQFDADSRRPRLVRRRHDFRLRRSPSAPA